MSHLIGWELGLKAAGELLRVGHVLGDARLPEFRAAGPPPPSEPRPLGCTTFLEALVQGPSWWELGPLASPGLVSHRGCADTASGVLVLPAALGRRCWHHPHLTDEALVVTSQRVPRECGPHTAARQHPGGGPWAFDGSPNAQALLSAPSV